MEPLDSRGRRVARGAVIVCLTAGVLLAAATPSGDPGPQEPQTTGHHATASEEPAGYKVYLDDNGRPVAPPPVASSVAVVPSGAASVPQSRPPLVETDAPGGGKMIVLDDRFRMYSVARIGPDNRASIDCARRPHGHEGAPHEVTAANDAHDAHGFDLKHCDAGRHEAAASAPTGHENTP